MIMAAMWTALVGAFVVEMLPDRDAQKAVGLIFGSLTGLLLLISAGQALGVLR
jgi:hypothetical protein